MLIGLTELFIGVGLVLGLAVRPISVVGMTYMLNLMLATWMAPGSNAGLWQYLDNEFKLIAMCFLFLLFGVGHAGECLGLCALYHRHRHVKWAEVEASQGEPEDVPKHDKTGERYLHDQIDPRYRMDGDDNARDRELSSLHSNLMP